MIKDVLQSIASVEIYPIIALLLFLIVFLAVALKTILMDKTELARISRLPLDEQNYSKTPTETADEQNKASGE